MRIACAALALSIVSFILALGTSFGQRSDYLRLGLIGAPQVDFVDIIRGIDRERLFKCGGNGNQTCVYDYQR